MKRLVFCFDGTTNTLDARFPTNVVRMAQSVIPVSGDETQLIYYDKGVGTDEGEKLKGGAFGFGLDKNLYEAYAFLIFNYTVGDEIFVFGFSRGAFTARSFVGLIYNCGIMRRRNVGDISQALEFYKSRDDLDHPLGDKMLEFRADNSPDVCVAPKEDDWRCRTVPNYQAGSAPLLKIKYVGVWDTVGALGIPDYMKINALDGNKYSFHDPRLAPFVERARHAVAIDERRKTFAPTLWSNIAERNAEAGADPSSRDAPFQQQWFPGDHGSVGGGGDRLGLSDQALAWIVAGARHAGLKVDSDPSSRVYEIIPNHREELANITPPSNPGLMKQLKGFVAGKMSRADRKDGPVELHEVSVSAKRRWLDLPDNLPEKLAYRPKTLDGVAEKLDALDPADFGVGVPLEQLNDPNLYDFHEVKAGETLGIIAKHHYGDPARFPDIFNANRDTLEHPDELAAGSGLRIPK